MELGFHSFVLIHITHLPIQVSLEIPVTLASVATLVYRCSKDCPRYVSG